MDKPSTVILPDFCTSGSTTAPSAGEITAGMAATEKLPAQLFNWLMKNHGEWIRWIGEGILQKADVGDNDPIFQTCDRSGNVRSYLTPEGYVMGPAIQQAHTWRKDGTSIANGTMLSSPFAAMEDSGGVVTIENPSSSSPKISAAPVVLTVPTSGGADTSCALVTDTSTGHVVGDLTNVVAVLETWLCKTDSAQEAGVYFGFHSGNYAAGFTGSDANESTSNNFCHFRASYNNPETDITWQCVMGDSTGKTVVDTGISCVSMSEFSHFRIEFHGLNSPVGADAGAAVGRFFIDGVLEAEIDTKGAVVSGFGVGAVLGSWAGASADAELKVGPIKLAWNCVLNGTPPA